MWRGWIRKVEWARYLRRETRERLDILEELQESYVRGLQGDGPSRMVVFLRASRHRGLITLGEEMSMRLDLEQVL